MTFQKIKFALIFITALLTCFTSLTFAESVVVKRDRIFIANNGLVVKNLHTGNFNQCTESDLYDPAGNNVTQLLNTATDIVVKHDYAIVTIHPLDVNGNVFTDTVTVEVSSCFEDKKISVRQCISTVDIDKGHLIIPCVEINGSYVTVHMDRRGKSDNWEVSFFGDNPNMKHFDDDDDYDDNDEDDYHRHNRHD